MSVSKDQCCLMVTFSITFDPLGEQVTFEFIWQFLGTSTKIVGAVNWGISNAVSFF